MKISDVLFYIVGYMWVVSLFLPMLEGWHRTAQPWESLNWVLFSVYWGFKGYRIGKSRDKRTP
jgi:hypothetical protein